VRVTVRLGSLSLRNNEIDRLVVRQALGEHGLLTVTFTRDQSSNVTLPDLLGARATVTLKEDGGPGVTAFIGTVSSGAQRHLANFGSAFEIEAHTASRRLEYCGTAYYPQHTLAEVVQKLGAEIVEPAPASEPFDYVQYGESEFDFLVRIADDHGCFVRTSAETPEVCSEFQDTGLELTFGYELLEVAGRCDTVNQGYKGAAYQVDGKRDHQFHGIARAPEWFSGAPTLVDKVVELAPDVEGGGDANVLISPRRSPAIAAAREALLRESERRLAGAVVVEGTSVSIAVAAGDLVTLNDSERSALLTTGTFGVTEVVHRLENQQYSNTFTASPAPRFGHRRTPGATILNGLVTGEVVDNVDPDGMGRLQVRYRWQADAAGDPTLRTDWVRVVTPYAGRERGFAFLPEVGDEVVLGFELGDPERPFVLGSTWNGVDTAPETAGDGNDNGVKQVVTRRGNTIKLVDDEDAEVIEVFSANGTCFLQLKNEGPDTGTLTIHSEGDIALEAPNGTIRMKCQTLQEWVAGDAFLQAENVYTKVLVDSRSVVGSILSLKGAGGVKIEASDGDLTLKGSTVYSQPDGGADDLPSGPAFPDSVTDGETYPTPAETWDGTSTADAPTPRPQSSPQSGGS
jgi:uncharacterized protein involved in type VI secretion and phage assembly